ncbi:hypothetical protein H5410_046614 [Solanum commersonii]|uniref:Uncharacterized protein n=1 Tax=Solanum commersonii TaxID=4109 RepID=A0A9J5XG03_SOLCO|nr:hypothetical protein H5410_046614 [Solanum commersonii]
MPGFCLIPHLRPLHLPCGPRVACTEGRRSARRERGGALHPPVFAPPSGPGSIVHYLAKAIEEAQHLKKLIQDFIASFIKVGNKIKTRVNQKILIQKKFKANAMRRPTGSWISDEPSRVNISKSLSFNYSLTHQSHNASTHVAPQSGYTISTPTVVPSSKLPNIASGYSHLGRGSNIPSSSASQCNSLNTSSGSIRLSNIHIESNGSEPNTPTTQHSDAHAPQPGDRDNFRRLIIEPLGYKRLFTHRGAISQVTRKERMEKELGIAVREMFKVTHAKKSTNPTKKKDGLSHAAQETYDRYIRISQEYHSTLPLESQDRPFTQEENENLWK